MMEDKGFFGSLFDLSFSEFITTKIIKVLYVIGVIISAVFSIVFMFKGFSSSILAGIGTIALSPVVFLLQVVLLRISMEMVIVLFRIAENIQRMAHGEGPSEKME